MKKRQLPTLETINKLRDERDSARAQVAALKAVLLPFLDDEPCSFDHHGYCQTHGVTSPCIMLRARKVYRS